MSSEKNVGRKLKMIYIVILLAVLLILALYSLGMKDKECQKLQEENKRIKELINIYMDVTQEEIESLDRIVKKAKEKGFEIDSVYNRDVYCNWLKMDNLAKEFSKYSIASYPVPFFMHTNTYNVKTFDMLDCCCQNSYAALNNLKK